MTQICAKEKILQLLAIRDHSAKELEYKLQRKRTQNYTKEEINSAIQYAKQKGWIAVPEILAEQIAQNLHQKLKGYLYIRQYLIQKGLPVVAKNSNNEITKARILIKRRLSSISNKICEKEILRIKRFLLQRGFDHDCIRKALNNT